MAEDTSADVTHMLFKLVSLALPHGLPPRTYPCGAKLAVMKAAQGWSILG